MRFSMKKFFLFQTAITMIFLAGCGSTEKKETVITEISKDELVGTWTFDDGHVASFSKDNTFSILGFVSDNVDTKGTYELQKDKKILLSVNNYWEGSLNDANELQLNINGIGATFVKEDGDASVSFEGVWIQKDNEDSTIEMDEDCAVVFYNAGRECITPGVTYYYKYDQNTKTFGITADITMDIGLNGDKLHFNNVDFTKEK